MGCDGRRANSSKVLADKNALMFPNLEEASPYKCLKKQGKAVRDLNMSHKAVLTAL